MTVNRETFTEVYNRYRNSVYSVALTRVRNVDDASDILQDTFIKLLSSDLCFASEEHLKAWLLRVAINLSINLLRSKAHSSNAELTDDIPYYDTIEDNELIKVVDSLPEEYRTVIHLFYYEEYSTSEIARLLDMKESTVRVRIMRGREKLRKKLKADEWIDKRDIM